MPIESDIPTPVRRPAIVWPLALLAACTAPFAKLDGVVVGVEPNLRAAVLGEYGRVQIIDRGSAAGGSPRMSIGRGWSVQTAPDGVAMMTLGAGSQIILDPGTDVTIENTSVVVRVGRVIIKQLAEGKAALTVKTETGTALAEGAEFIFEVRRDRSVAVTVLAGRVRVFPIGRAGRPDTVLYVGGERGGWLAAGPGMTRPDPVPGPAADSLRRRIADIERVVRPEVADVAGMPEAKARQELERRGFRVTTASVRTGRVPVGLVVHAVPAPGTRRQIGDQVQIDVEGLQAGGNQPAGSVSTFARITVPNLIGQTLETTERMLTAKGLLLGDTTSAVDTGTLEGLVLRMTPLPDALVRPGSRVNVTISRRRPRDRRGR